jgi:hypothetical protein
MRRSDLSQPRLILLHLSLFLLPVAAWAQTPSPDSRIVGDVNESVLVTLRGNTHPLAQPQFDQGAAPPDLPMSRMLLVLKRSDAQESALQTLLDAQQDRNSPNYHQWLTPDSFGQQFGPSDQDFQAVASWLQSHGFQLAPISRGRTVIEFSGTAAQVQQAFHTEIHKYTVSGEDHWANASDPQIPAALAPVVAGVTSLHNFPKQPAYHLGGVFSRSKATGRITSLQPGYTVPNACGGITCYFLGPYDFATIYNVLPLWSTTPAAIDGTGQNIAIIGESNINPQDVADFRNLFGLPPNVPNVIIDGADPGLASGPETEADLDVEWSGAVARGATINLVIAQPTEATSGVDLAAVRAVEDNIAPIISESFLQCELFLGAAGNSFQNSIREQAAAQGITFLTASGDQGSSGCDFFSGTAPDPATHGLMVNGLATSPYGIAVGGTDFLNFGPTYNQNAPSPYWSPTNDPHQASALGYVPETTWNSTCTNNVFVIFKYGTTPETSCNNSQAANWVETIAAGGGKSNCTSPSGSSCSGGYSKPSWQSAPGVPADGARDIPDVSLFASSGFLGSAYIVCESDRPQPHGSCGLNTPEYDFLGIGGTSVSTPAFAGIMALVNQFTQSAGQGNANHVLYKLAASPSQTNANCNASANPAGGCIFNDVTNGTIATPCTAHSLNCNLSIAGDMYGVLSGYSAAAGYDLATGLGSVNAYNLVHAWAQPEISTATTLSLNSNKPVNITHGQAVSFNISVLPAPATGDVSLIGFPSSGNPVAMGGFLTLQNGTVSGTTTSLAGGTSYQVKAHYAGDNTYAPSDSAPVTVTVAPEPSTTLISIPVFDPTTGRETGNVPTSLVYGSPYIERVDVGNAGAKLTYPPLQVCATMTCPTGNVVLTDSLNRAPATPLGTTGSFALNSEGYAEFLSIQLVGGSHQLSASYSGDNSYKPSSGTYSISVTPAIMQLSLELPASTVFGVPFEISMTGTTTVVAAPPEGTLSIYDGSTLVLSLTGAGLGGYGGTGSGSGGTATAGFGLDTAITLATLGSHLLTMTYTGDPNYSAASTSPQNVQVVYPTLLTLQSATTAVNYGTNSTLTATLTTSQTSPPITGQITFTSGSGQQAIPAGPTTQTMINGFVALQATATITPISGDYYVANYSGDSNYSPTSGTSPYISVNYPSLNVALSQPGLAITAGQSASLTITATASFALSGSAQFQLPFPVVQGVTCSINPGQIQLAGANSVSATLTCNVPAPSSSNSTSGVFPSSRWPRLGPRDRWWKVSGLLAALALALWLLPIHLRLRRLAHACLLLGVISFAVGCGGGSSGGDGGGGTGGGGPATPTNTTLNVLSTKVATSTLPANVIVTGTNSPTGSVSLGVVGESYSFNTATMMNGGAQFEYYLGLPGAFSMTALYSGDSKNLASQVHTPLTVVQTGVAGSIAVNINVGPAANQTTIPITIQ